MEQFPDTADLEYIPEEEAIASSPVAARCAPRPVPSKAVPRAARADPQGGNLRPGLRPFSWNLRNTRHSFKSAWVRLLDASNGLLLRLREHLKPPEEAFTRPAARAVPAGRGRAPAREFEDQKKSAAMVKEPRSRLRRVFMVLLGLVVSAIAGMIFSYSLLSAMIVNQAQKIDDQMEEISQLGRQYSRILTSEATYRKDHQECQRMLEDAEQDLAHLTAAAAQSLSSPAPAAGQAARGRVVDCYLGTQAAAGDLARCIKVYNQR